MGKSHEIWEIFFFKVIINFIKPNLYYVVFHTEQKSVLGKKIYSLVSEIWSKMWNNFLKIQHGCQCCCAIPLPLRNFKPTLFSQKWIKLSHITEINTQYWYIYSVKIWAFNSTWKCPNRSDLSNVQIHVQIHVQVHVRVQLKLLKFSIYCPSGPS